MKPPTTRSTSTSPSCLHRPLLASIALFTVAGCSSLPFPDHLHDQKRQDTAEKLKKDLENYAVNSPKAYAAMQGNVEKFRLHEDVVMDNLGANAHSAFVQALPGHTKANLLSEMEGVKATIVSTKGKLATEAMIARTGQKKARADAASASKEIVLLKSKVANAEADVTRWNATIALLKEAAANAPSRQQETKNDPKTAEQALASLAESVQSVGNKEVSFEDSDGKMQKKKVRDVLKDVIVRDGKVDFRLPRAPGIKLRILMLGLQVAEAERDHAQMRANRAAERLLIYENVFKECVLAEQLVADADEALTLSGYRDNIPLAQWFEQQAVIGRGERNDLVKAINEQQEEQKSQEQLQQQQNEELPNEQQRRQQQEKRQQKHFMAYRGALNGNAELLQTLRLLSTARALAKKNSAFVEIESRRLDHLDSIAISEHNDRVHQLYFQGAADGLVAYHRGGFSKEDAAQIVRIAQAVGVGFLASGSTH